MKKHLNRLLAAAGKDVKISEDIPLMFLVSEILTRSVSLLRGFIRLQKPVFIYRNVQIRGRNLKIGKFVSLERGVVLNTYAQTPIEIGTHSRIGAHTIISASNNFTNLGKGVKIGANSGIGQFGFIGASGGVTIGSKVIMGQFVSFHASNHVFSDLECPIKDQGTTAVGIIVEDDVWVGAKVTFLDGAIVREHSVVAAGAVVSGEFPPNVVIGGVPARVIKTLD
ncbi:acetyltransferase-like isoleucine patch superfamily enzyme [Rhodobacter sp. JA431]|uniref:acyltransferase n=1 Tax=Rhodobacter sp. JA431 TaxID=570013 RepID=UPI000BDA9650|nr:acyltransferase [Rhodobacter sp. JA431]SOB97706.1 acetyltransferase-like isoleucine patch superfamily enzyme [Rhodobacter sp. JA431]